MAYIIFGVMVIICIGVAILAYKVVKEDRKMFTKDKYQKDDD